MHLIYLLYRAAESFVFFIYMLLKEKVLTNLIFELMSGIYWGGSLTGGLQLLCFSFLEDLLCSLTGSKFFLEANTNLLPLIDFKYVCHFIIIPASDYLNLSYFKLLM